MISLEKISVEDLRKQVQGFSLLDSFTKLEPWPYARLVDRSGSAVLRLVSLGQAEPGGRRRYYKDAGNWSLGFRVDGDKIFAVSLSGPTKSMEGLQLIPATKKEWEKDNGRYAPDYICDEESEDEWWEECDEDEGDGDQ